MPLSGSNPYSLSVVLPNFNHATHLPKTLESIFSQSLAADEVIVIDDASTDNSLEILQEFRKKHPQLRIVVNESNLGAVQTINRGIQESRGSHLVFCAADDFIFPGFFEKASKILKLHPSLGLCCGEISQFKDILPLEHLIYRPTFKIPRVFSPPKLRRILQLTPFFIHSSATIFKREAIVAYGGLKESLGSLSDWYLNWQIAFHYGVAYLPELFGAFRLDENSYSQKQKKGKNRNELYRKLLIEINRGGKKWNRFFVSTGLLSHIGVPILPFLLAQPRYWAHLIPVFIKKIHLFIHKLQAQKQTNL